VTQSGEHLTDEQVSAFIDAQLAPEEAALVGDHLAACLLCQEHADDLRSLVAALGGLPELALPRDFALPASVRPRVITEPPNVVRLRRWYTTVRVGAASLAAAFVFLSLGTLYIDSRPAAPAATLASRGTASSSGGAAESAAPQPPAANAPPASNARAAAPPSAPAAAPQSAPGAASQSAPAAAPQSAPAAASAGSRSQAPAAADAADQQAAATTVRPLAPTAVPTAVPTVPGPAAVASDRFTRDPLDPAAPLRSAAVLVGILATLSILAALFIRHRLRAMSHLPSE
jgi:hypothetical protein